MARILLLLAMDKCASVKAVAFGLAQFHRVDVFMGILRDPNVGFPISQDQQTHNLVQQLDAKWENWRMGFNHFVQLTDEPTEACL